MRKDTEFLQKMGRLCVINRHHRGRNVVGQAHQKWNLPFPSMYLYLLFKRDFLYVAL